MNVTYSQAVKLKRQNIHKLMDRKCMSYRRHEKYALLVTFLSIVAVIDV